MHIYDTYSGKNSCRTEIHAKIPKNPMMHLH